MNVKFMNVKTLIYEQCGVKKGPLREISLVKVTSLIYKTVITCSKH